MQIYLFVLIQAAQYDFMYGVQYAWNLVVFNLVMTYSLTTPVIVPFGELYLLAPEPEAETMYYSIIPSIKSPI